MVKYDDKQPSTWKNVDTVMNDEDFAVKVLTSNKASNETKKMAMQIAIKPMRDLMHDQHGNTRHPQIVAYNWDSHLHNLEQHTVLAEHPLTPPDVLHVLAHFPLYGSVTRRVAMNPNASKKTLVHLMDCQQASTAREAEYSLSKLQSS